MKRHYVFFTAIFFVMLLLPVSWEVAHSVRNGEFFTPLDIFCDATKPFGRETLLQKQSDSLTAGLESIFVATKGFVVDSTVADSASVEKALDSEVFENAIANVRSIAQNMKKTLMEINAYQPLDSTDSAVQKISAFEHLLSGFELDTIHKDSLVKMAMDIQKSYAVFSWKRLMNAWFYHGFLNGKYLRAYEKRLEKENSFVIRARPLYQAFAWNVLRDPGEKAVLADSNFLFYRQDVDFLVKPAPWLTDCLDNPIEAVLDFKEELAKRGVELMVVVVPGKPSIYPEILNPVLYGLSGRNISLGRRFVDTLKTLKVNVVNLYPVLKEAKQNDRHGDFLYLNTDTHWTPRGARVAAKAVAKAVKKLPLAKELPKEKLTDSLVMADRTGDVATMADLEYAFPVQTVEARQILNANTHSPRRADFRKAKILILGDSYSRIYETDAPMSAGWISQFAYEMQTPVASIVSDGGSSTLVREKLARRSGVLKGKKLVIWEFVERDLRFGAEGWKKVRLD